MVVAYRIWWDLLTMLFLVCWPYSGHSTKSWPWLKVDPLRKWAPTPSGALTKSGPRPKVGPNQKWTQLKRALTKSGPRQEVGPNSRWALTESGSWPKVGPDRKWALNRSGPWPKGPQLKPYPFTHPNPTNTIISWIISWQTIPYNIERQ
jgi:hypothetical protein